jgi:hypothetical protein
VGGRGFSRWDPTSISTRGHTHDIDMYIVLAMKGKEEDGVEEKEEIAWLWRRNKVEK